VRSELALSESKGSTLSKLSGAKTGERAEGLTGTHPDGPPGLPSLGQGRWGGSKD